MKKLYAIFMIVGAGVVIAVPSIFLGVYFSTQNRLENTNVSVESFSITSLTNESLTGDIHFNVSNPTTMEATFRIIEINVSYGSDLLGTCNVSTDEFSIKEASHQTDFNLIITDSIAFSNFFYNYTILESLEIDLDVLIELTGPMSISHNKFLTKTVIIMGLGVLD
jgi:hypothetical protein